MKFNLSRDEASCMKGLAILCIVLHNLLHLVGPLVKENEFWYNYNFRSYWMWRHITENHPNLFGDILSFFGWYGVPVFIFLSGYGITKKYGNPQQDASWGKFIGYNFKKLWMLMLPVYLLYLLLGVTLWEKEFPWHAIIGQLTLTNNLWVSPHFIDPGVYWYFGLTLQLYLVYRLFLHRKSTPVFWTWTVVLAIFSLALSFWLLPDERAKVQPDYEYYSHNCIRWLLPFLMGVMGARFGKGGKENRMLHLLAFFLSTSLLIACSFHQGLWLLTPVFAVLMFISFIKLILWIKPLKSVLCWMGGISAYLFAAHPVVRPFFTDLVVEEGQQELDACSWLWTLAFVLIAVAVAWGYRWLSKHYLVSLCERIINSCLKWVSFKKK